MTGGPATIRAAFSTVLTVAANPSASAQAARAKAGEALDQKLLPLAIRIEHPAVRDFVLSTLALLRELVTDATAKSVARNAAALWQRAAAIGGRLVTTLLIDALPGGGDLRELVVGAVRGLADSFADVATFSRTLAGAATTVLKGAAERVGALLQSVVRERVGEPVLATLLSGAIGAGVRLLADPQRWKALATEGIGVLLGLVTPYVQRFVTAAIAQVGKLRDELRGFVDSFVKAIGGLLSDVRRRTELAKNPAVALVRAGFEGLKGFLVAQLSRARGAELVVPSFSKAIDALVALVLDPAARDRFLKLNAAKAFAAVAPDGLALALKLLRPAIRDPDLAPFVEALLRGAVGALTSALAAPARVADFAKQALATKLLPALKTLLAAKLKALLSRAPAIVKELLPRAFDAVTSFAADALEGKRDLVQTVTQGGKKLVAPLVAWVMSFATKELEVKLAADKPLRNFVVSLVGILGNAVSDPAALVAAVQKAVRQKDPLPVLQLVLPHVAGAPAPILQAKLVAQIPAGPFQILGRFSVNELLGLLRKPADLVAIVKETSAGAWAKLKPRLLGLAQRLVQAFTADGDATTQQVAKGMGLVVASLGGGGGNTVQAGAAGNLLPLPDFTIPKRTAGTMRVASARFGGNLKQPHDNVKPKFVRECNGKQRCRFALSALADPAPGRPKDLFVEWTCGGRRRRITLTPSTSTERRVFLSCNPKEADLEEAPGVAAAALANATRALGRSFYHCKKCGGLVHWAMKELRAVKKCAGGGQHDNNSGEYYVATEAPAAEGQEGWGKCRKCKALTHASNAGKCSHDGAHEHDPATMYRLTYGGARPKSQDNWRFCSRCSMLYYGATRGKCPQGGVHAAGSWNYNVRTKP